MDSDETGEKANRWCQDVVVVKASANSVDCKVTNSSVLEQYLLPHDEPKGWNGGRPCWVGPTIKRKKRIGHTRAGWMDGVK